MTAYEMLLKVQEEVEKVGYEIAMKASERRQSFSTKCEFKSGERYICGEVIYRHNGTEEDASVRICVLEIDRVLSQYSATLKNCLAVKISKEASEKVFMNRMKKILESAKR